ncbi:MAG: hypothetical protein IJK56_08675 [Firmicutes bacterium]|nr:hypothetical protein [Bacillota bacterium]
MGCRLTGYGLMGYGSMDCGSTGCGLTSGSPFLLHWPSRFDKAAFTGFHRK